MEGEKAGGLSDKRFRLFGIPVRTSVWFFPAVAGFGWFVVDFQLFAVPLFVAAMTLAIVAHEFAHAFAGRWFGGRGIEVALTFFGGYCTFGYSNYTRRMELAITAAGPLVNLFLAGSIYLAARFLPSPELPEWAARFFVWFFLINLVLGVFNLVPVLPLDGGHILRFFVGDKRLHWVCLVGVVVSLGLVLLGLRFNDWLMIACFAYFGWQNAGTFLAWRRLGRNVERLPDENRSGP